MGTLRHRWVYLIKMDLGEIRWSGKDRLGMAQDTEILKIY
jgi:hypothetical protein